MKEQRLRPHQPAWWIAGLIRGYQVAVSPLLGRNCRYEPSCSHYGLEAVQNYGALKGGWMAIKRIGRCHPFRPGGYDPVPNIEEVEAS